MQTYGRRRLLAGLGTAVAVGVAGCQTGQSDADSNGGSTDTDEGGDTEMDTTTAETETAAVPESVADYMSGANGYDGIVDARGQDTVVVDVGAGDGFAFDPAGVRVDSSATVSWQWTGRGGSHNVVSANEADTEIDSGDAVADRDPFEQSFDNTGSVPYFCEVHRGSGMLGVVLVGDG